MDEKTNIQGFAKEVADILNHYLHRTHNGKELKPEDVVFIAPYLELNKKLEEVAHKYGIQTDGWWG